MDLEGSATPGQAADVARVIEATKRTFTANGTDNLSATLSLVAQKATDDRALAVAWVVSGAIKGEKDPLRLAMLADIFRLVAERANPEQSAAVARPLADAVKDPRDPGLKLDPSLVANLAKAFAPVTGRAKPEESAAIVGAILDAVGRVRYPNPNSERWPKPSQWWRGRLGRKDPRRDGRSYPRPPPSGRTSWTTYTGCTGPSRRWLGMPRRFSSRRSWIAQSIG